jgi:hypothetical protein
VISTTNKGTAGDLTSTPLDGVVGAIRGFDDRSECRSQASHQVGYHRIRRRTGWSVRPCPASPSGGRVRRVVRPHVRHPPARPVHHQMALPQPLRSEAPGGFGGTRMHRFARCGKTVGLSRTLEESAVRFPLSRAALAVINACTPKGSGTRTGRSPGGPCPKSSNCSDRTTSPTSEVRSSGVTPGSVRRENAVRKSVVRGTEFGEDTK